MYTNELIEDLDVISAFISEHGFAGSTILVTGVTGLIGSLIVRSLSRFNEQHSTKVGVIAIARNKDKVTKIFNRPLCGVEFYYQDICDKISEEIRTDYIIHTASPTASQYLISYPVESIDCIFTGTKNMLEFARRVTVKGIVFLSSMEVFGKTEERTDKLRENELGYIDLQNVRSCYPEAKRLAECLCKSYAAEYGLPVKTARLAQVFGAGVQPMENRVFAQFARSATNGENIVLHTTGDSVGNYCYTRDAIKAILLLLKTGSVGDVYTVVNEESTMTIREMAQLVADNFSNGKSKVVFDIPEDNTFGYASPTKMRLSSGKMRYLGWEPDVGLLEAYRRMIPGLLGE